jgi:transcriptional repressor NF-X1
MRLSNVVDITCAERPHDQSASHGASTSNAGPSEAPRGGGGGGGGARRAKFNARLTDVQHDPHAPAPRQDRVPYTHPALTEGDLTSTLINDLRTPPYPDCPICFNAIHPGQPSWSCSPSTAIASDNGEELEPGSESARCCWTTFHLKCIRSWASKSVKDMSDAWKARGEDRPGDWRCPGCQAKRLSVPSGYW